MPWQQISIITNAEHALAWEDILFAQGAVSVTFADSEDQPILEPKPGEAPLWTNVTVTSLFEADSDTSAIDQCLSSLEDKPWSASWQWEELPDQDWERAWLDDFKPMQFGENLWIVPSQHEPPHPEATNIRLDPGLAFGTGTHATTAQCLSWLDGKDFSQQLVMDYGCGSGILAVAAALLKAPKVLCVDIDPQAITATKDNAARNHVANAITFIEPEQQPEQPVDLLMANILAQPLVSLMPFFYECVKPGGSVILSGILQDQAQQVIDRYKEKFQFALKTQQEEWVFLHFTKDN